MKYKYRNRIVKCLKGIGECALVRAAVATALLATSGCRPESGEAKPQKAKQEAGREDATVVALRALDAQIVYRELTEDAAAIHADLSLAKTPGAALDLVTQLPHVERLNLHAAALTSADFSQLVKLTELRWLDLSDTPVTSGDLAFLEHLPRLEFLILWGTRVGDDGVEEIARLQNLQKLDLSGTSITEQGLGKLAVLTKLLELHVEVPAIGRPAIVQLQQQLPHTLISR